MERNINIRNYREEDTPAVVGLLSGFYDNVKTEEDWRRLYLDNPAGSAVISLAEETSGKKLIGHYSVIKMEMSVFGEKRFCGKGEGEIFDLPFLIGLLKRGVKIEPSSEKLIRHTMNAALACGLEMVCTNPNDLALKSHIAAGYDSLRQEFSIFVLPLKSRYLSHVLTKKKNLAGTACFISSLVAPLIHFLYSVKVLFFGRTGVCLDPIGSFDSRTDIFAEALGKDKHVIAIDRSAGHLNWRFGKEEYKKYVIRDGGKDIGYAVLHVFINPNGFKEACLVDYLFLPEGWGKFKGTIVKITEEAKKYDSDLLRVNYMHDRKETFGLAGVLKELFFTKRSDKRNITVFLSSQLEDEKEKILDIKNWFFTDLYFEGY
ncbi:MAG: hypothetical protein ABIG55_03640 [Candidatus Omnitrophota bacterium]|nr:hypothetical protein [Candidatus Omnitrophota bacterium]